MSHSIIRSRLPLPRLTKANGACKVAHGSYESCHWFKRVESWTAAPGVGSSKKVTWKRHIGKAWPSTVLNPLMMREHECDHQKLIARCRLGRSGVLDGDP
jgi:hypothetical protein